MVVKWQRIALSIAASLIVASCSVGEFEKAACVTGNYNAKYIGNDGTSYVFSFTERGRHVELSVIDSMQSDNDPIQMDGSFVESGYEVSDFVIVPNNWPPIGSWEGEALKCKSSGGKLDVTAEVVHFSCGYTGKAFRDEFFYSKDRGITKIIFGVAGGGNKGAVVLGSSKGISMPCDRSKLSG